MLGKPINYFFSGVKMFEDLVGFLPSFIITFRETLEAALIIGIILAFLNKTNQTQYNKHVYFGTIAAIIGSLIAAIAFNVFLGGFEGQNEEIFEGILMITGTVLISWMILWMMQQRHIAQKLETEVSKSIQSHNAIAIAGIVFVSVLREGVETVIFLGALGLKEGTQISLAGGIIGVIGAVLLGYALFKHFLKIKLKTVFNTTSILLILFAAGLLAHGIHEFEEAGIIPITIEHVWDINPPLNPDKSFPLLHEKGLIGSIATGLFGYNANPSLTEVIAYLGYLTAMYFLWKKNQPKQKMKQTTNKIPE